jgi:hypothetical protein
MKAIISILHFFDLTQNYSGPSVHMNCSNTVWDKINRIS